MVIRNTGLLESGEVIRATVLRMATPIPMLVTGCGHDKMTEASITPEDLPTMELLIRSDVNSINDAQADQCAGAVIMARSLP